MKLCVPVMEDKGLQSPVCEHFGSAPFFMIADTDTGACRAITNENQHHAHGICQPLAILSGQRLDGVVVRGIWTAVRSRYVGMSHTYKTGRKVQVTNAGAFAGASASDLAELCRSWEPLDASVGLAALNSLIEPRGDVQSVNALIEEQAEGKVVSIIGRFPFTDRVAPKERGRAPFELEGGGARKAGR